METVPKQKLRKGNFQYNKAGKVVFKASKEGRWILTSQKAFDLISDSNSPIYQRGIDPYQPES